MRVAGSPRQPAAAILTPCRSVRLCMFPSNGGRGRWQWLRAQCVRVARVMSGTGSTRPGPRTGSGASIPTCTVRECLVLLWRREGMVSSSGSVLAGCSRGQFARDKHGAAAASPPDRDTGRFVATAQLQGGYSLQATCWRYFCCDGRSCGSAQAGDRPYMWLQTVWLSSVRCRCLKPVPPPGRTATRQEPQASSLRDCERVSPAGLMRWCTSGSPQRRQVIAAGMTCCCSNSVGVMHSGRRGSSPQSKALPTDGAALVAQERITAHEHRGALNRSGTFADDGRLPPCGQVPQCKYRHRYGQHYTKLSDWTCCVCQKRHACLLRQDVNTLDRYRCLSQLFSHPARCREVWLCEGEDVRREVYYSGCAG